MNVLVTGGAGFIGSHIADALLAAGHRVTIVDNLRSGHRHNVPVAATLHTVDIVDADALAQVFEQEEIHAVVHQAALANVRESMTDPIEYATVNVLGTLNLLELARKHECKRVVFASTGGAVYGEGYRASGPSPLPFTEESRPQPKDNYGANKLSIEYHLDLYHANYGLEYVALRYANIYGPRQDSRGEAGVIAIFAGAMLTNQPTRITGDGKQIRDFTYVGDVARANLMALESTATGIFNVGTGRPSDIKTVHTLLREATGYGQDAAYVPRPMGEVVASYVDPAKAGRTLGWQAEISLEEGLQRTVDWFRTRAAAADA
ncbi:MAG: NAD-dependent epimerase/dehydratase family protein [Litorilinea sp.]